MRFGVLMYLGDLAVEISQVFLSLLHAVLNSLIMNSMLQ